MKKVYKFREVRFTCRGRRDGRGQTVSTAQLRAQATDLLLVDGETYVLNVAGTEIPFRAVRSASDLYCGADRIPDNFCCAEVGSPVVRDVTLVVPENLRRPGRGQI